MKWLKMLVISIICIFLALFTACPPIEGDPGTGDPITGNPTSPPPSTPTASATTTIPSGPAPSPPPAGNIKFFDVNGGYDTVSGKILVQKAWDESNISKYNLYLGTDEVTKYSSNVIGYLSPNGSNQVYNLPEIVLPPGVKYILVSTVNRDGIESTIAADLRAAEIIDIVYSRMSDLNPGALSSNPQNLCLFNSRIYFKATESSIGNELGYYDDSTETAVMLPDTIKPGSGNMGSSSPDFLTVFNNKLYFQAFSEAEGVELWSCDTDNTLKLAYDINPGSNHGFPKNLIVYTDPGDGSTKLYFQADNGTAGKELFSYDAAETLSLVADINSGMGDSMPEYLTVYRDKLYFVAYVNAIQFNGNPGTEIKYFSANTGVATPYIGFFSPNYLKVYNDMLFFQAYTPAFGTELSFYNETASSYNIVDINNTGNSNAAYLTPYDNHLYFSAISSSGGNELWYYDAPTKGYKEFDINPSTGSDPKYLTAYDYKLFFQADGGVNGIELWVYDAFLNEFAEVDLYKGSIGSNPDNFIIYNNALYFSADTGDGSGKELYRLFYHYL